MSESVLEKRNYMGTPATAPGPSGPRMLGDFAGIRTNPVRYLGKVWAEYGDVVQFPVPRPPSYFVNDPAGVRRVLVGNWRNYGKATIQYRSLSAVTGEGLLTADTPAWRQQRPLVQPAFHNRTLEAVARVAVPVAAKVADAWEQAGPTETVDVDAAMMQAALEIVGHALFGTDLSGDAERLTGATLDALSVVVARARPSLPVPSWVPTPNNRKLARSVAQLDGAVAGILAARPGEAPESADPKADMVAMLTGARDSHGAGLTNTQVRDQLVTFIVAGHETVASTLTWACALLAGHPAVQEQMQAEVAEVLGDRLPTHADLPGLTYTRAVVDEVLRLYPPAWLITRNALGPDELGGRPIPAGALVILSPWWLHRHPECWDRPADFDPERFRDGRADRTAFIPFGAGPRQCIGKDFAYVESVLVLATLMQRLTLSYPSGSAMPDFDPLVTVRPKGGLHLCVSTPR